MAKQLTSLLEPLMILVLGSGGRLHGGGIVHADVLHVRRHQWSSLMLISEYPSERLC